MDSDRLLSPTLAANEKVQALRAAGQTVCHMGFGQAPFPVHPRLQEALKAHVHHQAYLPVAGLTELCSAVRSHQERLTGLDLSAYDVIVAPGSKLILYALQMAIAGDIMLPVPSWVSYAPQARLLNQRIAPVSTVRHQNTLSLTPDTLYRAWEQATNNGITPRKLLINSPGNPTGVSVTGDELAFISRFCREKSITLIADEIYGRLNFDGQYISACRYYPEGTVITTGLSKHLSLGGWRLGVGLIPRSIPGLFQRMVHIASETWSCVSAPIQYAAIEAYAGHDDIEHYISECCSIHQCINTTIAHELQALGFDCPVPTGAFYTWPDFTSAARALSLSESQALADYLLEHYGVLGLPGSAFGEAADSMRMRLSGCDYEGSDALRALRRFGADQLHEHINDFAPQVGTALQRFQHLAKDCSA